MKAWKHLSANKEGGFSLVELMIVVGIIGVLATLAVPRFQQFQAKARMAEAKNMLNHVYTLQESHSLENNTYVAFTNYGRTSTNALQCTPPAGAVTLGFTIDPCAGAVPRYGYASTGAVGNFTARATTGANANNVVCGGNLSPAHEFAINQTRQFWGPVAPNGAVGAARVNCR
ncbi:MAG TPA: prepilin-type N-terminal cleavage/methylation domain-containing protein [Anaerolineaceae bacterium]|nr:prepilin-type N-terminal cleavage/methylation domain-containing protein [Anaerolineaceae bacterium]